jgi:hypothetical protein
MRSCCDQRRFGPQVVPASWTVPAVSASTPSGLAPGSYSQATVQANQGRVAANLFRQRQLHCHCRNVFQKIGCRCS